jgi:hypothetical protein
MDKLKLALTFAGIGIVVGAAIVAVLMLIFGAKLNKVNVGPIEFELPTSTPELQPTTTVVLQATSQPTPQPVVTVTDVPVQPTATPIPPAGGEDDGFWEIPSLCPDTVARSAVSMWDIGATDKGNVQPYLDDYESHRKRGGGFARGDTIPSGVIIATDFGNGESEVWQTYPVEPIVHYRSWGLFEVTRSFSAPSEGSCITMRQLFLS